MNWFDEQRIAWIIETIQIYGYMNRSHIMKKFNVSEPQANIDFREVTQREPRIKYNKASKRYEFDDE